MGFGSWLQEELGHRNLSISDFSRKVRVSPGTVSRWIHDHRRPEHELCERIAWVLEYDPDFVLIQAGHEPYPTAREEQLRLELERAETRVGTIDAELEHLTRERQELAQQIEQMHAELDRIETQYQHHPFEEALRAIDDLRLSEPIKDQLRSVVLDAQKDQLSTT